MKRVLGLVEMTCGLVHTSFSLPKWQAVKLAFFAACRGNIQLMTIDIRDDFIGLKFKR